MLRTMGTAPSGRDRATALVAFAAVVATTLILWVPGGTPASAAPIGHVTTYGPVMKGPHDITTGPDGNLWFTSFGTNSIGRMTPAGAVTTFPLPGTGWPLNITVGPDSNLWFTSYQTTSIGRITTAGVVTMFTDPAIDNAQDIATGADGNLWFTNADDFSIGRITPLGTVTTFTEGFIGTPVNLTAGPDGKVWFTTIFGTSIYKIDTAGVVTELDDPAITSPDALTTMNTDVWFVDTAGPTDSIGRVSSTGTVTEFPVGVAVVNAITPGPDGRIWFTTQFDHTVGRLDPATGDVVVFPGFATRDIAAITSGPDGALWFTSFGTDWIGRITTDGVVTNHTGTSINRPQGIARGADGNMWFTNSNGASIGRITPAGVISSFTHAGIVRPFDITPGPDGNLWFTNHDGNSIGRITTAGVVTIYPGAGIDHPYGITSGPDGALWFTNLIGSSIGRITTAGVVTTFSGVGISGPTQITAGPDGALWFTNRANSSIGRITTSGVVTNFTGAGIDGPFGIAAGPDGNLWFTNNYGKSVGRISTAGTVTIFTGGDIDVPYDIVAGPDGNLWFTNYNSNFVGRISTSGVVLPGYDLMAREAFGIADGGDGTMWFTLQRNYSIGRMVAANVPGAPSGVGGVRGNGQVAVSWSAPADDAGVPVSGYTVTSSPGAKTCSTTGALTCSVSGLTNGTAYTFTVKATNVIGVGPASSASAAVTPATVPGAPSGVSAAAGNAQATVAWSAPASTGGSPVTGYTVTSSPGAKTCSTAGPSTCVVSGLTNGTAYTFTVKATNVVGAGPASAASAAVTPAAVTAPGGPTGVAAAAGKQRATVSWSAPASNGGSPITVYTVTAAPGGATCSTTGALTCAVTGLIAGTSYTFTVRATNAIGQGPPSAVSSAVVPWDGSGYHAVTPERILDSRSPGTGFAGKVVSPTSRSLQVTGLGGPSNVPASATAVVMNVTVADASNESFLTVYPTGTTKPNASNLNFGAGQIIPNLVTVKLGTGGKVELANAAGGTHVIADVVGYYDDGTVAGDLFTGITPVRLLDSRSTTGGWSGPLPAGSPRDLVVRKPGNGLGVPATATAVVANVTVTGGTAQSFVSVWPSGQPQPNVSNLNLMAGQTIPNLVTVKIGTGGAIRVANAVGSVDVIVDVVGYFDPTAGSRFHAINPTRFLDTRVPTGLAGPQTAGETRNLGVAGMTGTNVPAGATALVANVTVADGLAESFVSVFPGNVARPDPFSNLNFGTFQVIPNLTVVGLAPNGSVNFYNHLGKVALIGDAVGYYAAT